MTVLILTSDFDPTADLVIHELTKRGVTVFRCDPGDFPQRLSLSARLDTGWKGTLRLAKRTVDLTDIEAVYYRRPSRFRLAAGMSRTERWFADNEARMGFGGIISALRCRWMSHPHRIAMAEYKPMQLALAEEFGLRVPKSLLTCDPAAADEFSRSLSGDVIYKPLSAGPAGENGRPVALYTTIIPPEDYGNPAVARTAHLFQEYLPKKWEVRLTVVAQTCFAVEIHAQRSPSGAVDWRTDYDSIEYRVTETPNDVRDGVLAMLNKLGLTFGAFDFVVSPDGGWIFLELNPNGQWAWLEANTGLRISSAIADFLRKGQ